MAGYLIRLERMCPIKFRRKPLLSIFLLFMIFTLFYKGIILLTAPPRLYKAAMATLKENYVIKEDRDDRAECTRRIRNINSYIVHLNDVIVNPKLMSNMERDKNHGLLIKGFFTVPCIGEMTFLTSSLFDGSGSHFLQWAKSVEVTNYAKNEESEIDVVEGYTFAVRRQDTDNAYLRILDMYNTYVTVRMMRRSPKDSYVLFIDKYPEHPTDKLWSIAFGEVSQLGDIHDKQRFENFIWVIPSRLGPVASLDLPLPYLDDFRHHVVTSGGAVTSDDVSCQTLRLTVLTYAEDTPDPSISNIAEIIQHLQKEYPQYEIMTTSSEAVNMHIQIQTLAKTDILIGVHGDDLGNTIFLHRGSGLIELFPTRHWVTSDTRFQQLAEWSDVYYLSWYNSDLKFRDSQTVTVDPSTIISLANSMKRIICSG